MRLRRVAGLALLAAAFLTACSAESTPTPSGADLQGRTFVSTEVEGAPIPGGGPLTVEFVGQDRISMTAGCNRGNSTVDLSDGTVVTGPIATTMMACVGDTAGADEWMTSLFEADPAWTLDGDTLRLTTSDTSVTLVDKKIANPDRPITGTTWVVDQLISPTAVTTSVALETAAPTLLIGDDGSVSGSTGCNRMTGTAQVAGDKVTFGPLATTMMACEPDVAEVERAVLGVLNGETTFTVDADRARVMQADGDGLGLRAR
ncbi:META domain-containing protein [Rhodococcus maanshanensis]|uniref:Heat shock protein HslJ n=1 Tax=Rhodococcus maanshanensis TaxID=183556 RepID=A0A1H7F9U1_9NOCA|nr:META domain-containing protein [Rhodococcus maanshanensis]SEK21152.1 heat shock protein HslJ [Rhodococcus maanshanensis]